MSDLVIDIYSLDRGERAEYRKKLICEGKCYCLGVLCKGTIKLLDEFPKRKNGKISVCNKCNAYNVNKSEKKNGKASDREKNRLKLGKTCAECGCDEMELLEFDHIDTEDKELTIAVCQSAKKILSEAEKTQLLCVWCHRLRSKKQIEENIKKSIEEYKYTIEEDNEDIDPLESKCCVGPICNGTMRNYNKFYVYDNKISTKCKICSTYNEKLKRLDNSQFVDDVKLKISECQECKKKVTVDTLCCFDFDHLDQNTKLYNIGKLRVSKVDQQIIKDEIEKCQLLCCICHKRKTIKQLGYKNVTKENLARYDHISIIKEEKVPSICPKCNKNEKEECAKECITCYNSDISRRKVVRPSFEILEKDISEMGYVKTGKKYGVTDKAISKWIKHYIKHGGKQLTKQLNDKNNRYTIRKNNVILVD